MENIPSIKLKRCSACQKEFPATTEFFYRYKSGFQSRCKECSKLGVKKFRAANPELWKQYDAKSYQKHADKRRKTARKSYNDHREEKLKQKREYTRQNADVLKERHHHWYSTNPDKVQMNRELRRTRQWNLPYDFGLEDWKRAIDYWEGRCCICGRLPDEFYSLTQEHWIPLADPRSDNPGTVINNILPMCHAKKGGRNGCNNSKHDTDPIIWLRRRFPEAEVSAKLREIEAFFSWAMEQRHNSEKSGTN